MDAGSDSSQLYLPGTSSKLNQLQFLSISDGGSNIFVGVNAGNKQPGSFNTFIGSHSGEFSSRASTNVFLGAFSGQKSDRVSDVVAVGYNAGKVATDNFSSVLIGSHAGSMITRARYNTAIGHKSMAYSLSGSQNTAVGALSGTNCQSLANSVLVGYGAGSNISGDFNVAVGALAGSSVVGVGSTLVGYKSGHMVRGNNVTTLGSSCLSAAVSAGNLVISGAAACRAANVVYNSVVIGAGAGEGIRNVEGSVVIGTRAGNTMTNSSKNVVVGDNSGVKMTNSTYNTIVGALSAENTTSNYTTMVGSSSMNRRDGNQVLFGNCVIVGENITFDTALGTETFTVADALRIVSSGVEITDPSHRSSFNPEGIYAEYTSAIWTIEEAGAGVALIPAERELTFSSTVLVVDATYVWEWYATSDDALNIVSTLYKATALIETVDGEITVTVSLYVEKSGSLELVASKVSTLAVPPDDGSNLWMDVYVRQTPQNPEDSQGIEVSWAFSREGSSYESVETDVEPGIDVDPTLVIDLLDGVIGFAAGVYATAMPDSLSYAAFTATADTLAFVQLVYNTRFDSTYVQENRTTGSAHAVTGSGTVNTVDELIEGNTIFQLNLVEDATHTGFTAASYDVGSGSIKIAASINFQLPDSGKVGLEWFSLHPTTSTTLGDGYVAELEFAGTELALTMYSRGDLLFACTGRSLEGISQVGVEGPGVPLTLQSARESDETWAELSILQQVNQPLQGIIVKLILRGYAAGTTDLLSPESVQTYTFSALDPYTPLDTVGLTKINVYANAPEGPCIARYFTASSVRSRSTPEFHNCVYIGSNYLVDRGVDASNAFVLSLGNNSVLMRGTAESLKMNSNLVHVSGSLLIGNSATHNYIHFGGTQGDGYENFVPSTYVGERIYEPNTERSELLIYKGEDKLQPLGPDRVRLVSHEFRVDMLVDDVVTPNSFNDAGNANVTTILLMNATSTTITGALDVSGGAATFGDAMDVTGAANFGNAVDVTGPATFGNAVDVTGPATFGNAVDVTGPATFGNAVGVTGPATFGNAVGVTGPATFQDTLGVTGAATFQDTLGVTGAATFQDTLGVTGAATFQDTLGVTGAATFQDTLGVTGALTAASFSGDGAALTGIPISGVAGLQDALDALQNNINMISLTPGPEGPTGPEGPAGPTGPEGPAGPPGP